MLCQDAVQTDLVDLMSPVTIEAIAQRKPPITQDIQNMPCGPPSKQNSNVRPTRVAVIMMMPHTAPFTLS